MWGHSNLVQPKIIKFSYSNNTRYISKLWIRIRDRVGVGIGVWDGVFRSLWN